MTDIDHAEQAQEWITRGLNPATSIDRAAAMGVAQVLATLALAEQQRIANRLKVAELDQLGTIAQLVAPASYPVDPAIRIRAYLTPADWALIEVDPEDSDD